jgi:TrmH family RNA methyltransferase
MQEITSTNNAKLRYLLQLKKKSSVRKEFGEFVIEGKREIIAALNNGYTIKSLYFCPDFISEKDLLDISNRFNLQTVFYRFAPHVYRKIAYRDSTEGIIALAKMQTHRLDELKLSENPLILVAEHIEKPGNIGAMLRSVDGSGADAMILANPVVDIYNPNVIRASIGTVFSTQIAVTDTEGLKNFLSENHINMYAATLQNANIYHLENYKEPVAIAVGAEDKGLSEDLRNLAQKQVYIPMNGQTDSLNVSVSAAILLYEAVRQRSL